MQKITIAIDGFSSTGKSTIAKQLAKHLGYIYVDTGAMYRAVTYYAMKYDFINATHFDVVGLVSKLHDIVVYFKLNQETGSADVYLNGENIEQAIRTLEVSNFVSQVAAIPEVRYQLVKQQQKMGAKKGIVMDGRDIGTVVFPEAELKIFMTASAETRATRRFNELINKGEVVTYTDVLHNIEERDFLDSNREDSPLRKAADAIEIDNSNLTIAQQFQEIVKLAEAEIKARN
ncbi:(d)CMP kinase [Bizionia sediminis]|uniref:Cytidylate kinase n=1 Tax=Bizionia sediminis TaxID=1737064 RepID=A0ABW5KUK0_9FLAO